METIYFLLAIQSALLFNMIILSKGVKGFLIKQEAIYKIIITITKLSNLIGYQLP